MKHLFFSLKPRERGMALFAILVAAGFWVTLAWGHVSGGWSGWQTFEAEAEIQKKWLGEEREIRKETADAVQGLDSGRGYDEAKLLEEAVNATRDAGLNANTETPKTQKGGRFAVHSLQMTCRKADLASVLKFYESVKTRAPYLAIGHLSMIVERGGTLTVKITVTALELIGTLPAGAKAAGEGEAGK